MSIRILMVLSILAVGACSRPTNKSRLAHDYGHLRDQPSRFEWFAMDEAALNEMDAQYGLSYYSSAHPVTRRLQAWADLMQSIVVNQSPELAVAPRSIVRIPDQASPSASAGGWITVCAEGPIVVGAPDPERASSDTLFQSADKASFELPEESESCRPVAQDKSEQLAFLQWALQGFSGCEVEALDVGFHLSSACVGNQSDLDHRSFQNFQRVAQMNVINYYRGLLEVTDEDEAVAILAHELGHHFGAHGLGAPDFIYDLGEQNAPHRPIPLSDPADPRLRTAQALKDLSVYSLNPVDGQTLDSALFQAIRDLDWSDTTLAENCLPDRACLASCQPLSQGLADDYQNQLRHFPWDGPLNAEQATAYFRYEADVASCFKDLQPDTYQAPMVAALQSYIPDWEPSVAETMAQALEAINDRIQRKTAVWSRKRESCSSRRPSSASVGTRPSRRRMSSPLKSSIGWAWIPKPSPIWRSNWGG